MPLLHFISKKKVKRSRAKEPNAKEPKTEEHLFPVRISEVYKNEMKCNSEKRQITTFV